MRLFYAISVPDDIIIRLARQSERAIPPWKPARPEQMHITLAFMGQVSEERLPDVIQAGEQAADTCPPFVLELEGTGCFPKYGPPRVWFAAIKSSDLLEQMALELRKSLKDFADAMPFRPHITLARTRKNTVCPSAAALNLSWRVKEIKLFKSTLTNSGAIHEQLKNFKLTK